MPRSKPANDGGVSLSSSNSSPRQRELGESAAADESSPLLGHPLRASPKGGAKPRSATFAELTQNMQMEEGIALDTLDRDLAGQLGLGEDNDDDPDELRDSALSVTPSAVLWGPEHIHNKIVAQEDDYERMRTESGPPPNFMEAGIFGGRFSIYRQVEENISCMSLR